MVSIIVLRIHKHRIYKRGKLILQQQKNLPKDRIIIFAY